MTTNFLRGRYRLSSFEISSTLNKSYIYVNGICFKLVDKCLAQKIEEEFFSGKSIMATYKFPEDITALSPTEEIKVEIHLEGDWVHVYKII